MILSTDDLKKLKKTLKVQHNVRKYNYLRARWNLISFIIKLHFFVLA